jgi:hypothetical protein
MRDDDVTTTIPIEGDQRGVMGDGLTMRARSLDAILVRA